MKYDLAVIGGGPGGYTAAIKAAQNGMKVALIEKDSLGGTCLNKGCIPTKALLHVSGLYREMKNVSRLGISLGEYSCDTKKMYQYKDEVVNKLANGVRILMKTNRIEVFQGRGIIIGSGKVRVDSMQELETEKILIATGSVPFVPNITGVDLPGVMTSDGILNGPIDDIKSITIVGGGVIGLEFANIFADLGRKVRIIESMDRLIANMDKELSQSITMLLKKHDVEIHTSAVMNRIEKATEGLNCLFTEKVVEHNAVSDAVLIATGRKAYVLDLTEDMDLEIVNGKIAVDSCYRTNLEGVYAIGDAIGGVQLAHMATTEGTLAVEHMLGKEPSLEINVVPSCIYTNPEMAQVGTTYAEAKKNGIRAKVGKVNMSANGRSTIEGVERGFVKLVADGSDRTIIGATIMGARATDLISEAALIIANHMTIEQALSSIRPHPTFAESMAEALEVLAAK